MLHPNIHPNITPVAKEKIAIMKLQNSHELWSSNEFQVNCVGGVYVNEQQPGPIRALDIKHGRGNGYTLHCKTDIPIPLLVK